MACRCIVFFLVFFKKNSTGCLQILSIKNLAEYQDIRDKDPYAVKDLMASWFKNSSFFFKGIIGRFREMINSFL